MSLHRGQLAYARCDGPRDQDGRPCPAFLVPSPTGDPSGPGHVFGGGWHVFRAAQLRGWQTPPPDGGPWLCPDHRSDPAAVRPEWDDDTSHDAPQMYRRATIAEIADHLHGMAHRGGSDKTTSVLLAAAKIVRSMADQPAPDTATVEVPAS